MKLLIQEENWYDIMKFSGQKCRNEWNRWRKQIIFKKPIFIIFISKRNRNSIAWTSESLAQNVAQSTRFISNWRCMKTTIYQVKQIQIVTTSPTYFREEKGWWIFNITIDFYTEARLYTWISHIFENWELQI